jgi:hypothetical protein
MADDDFFLITLPVENNRERTWQVGSFPARPPAPSPEPFPAFLPSCNSVWYVDGNSEIFALALTFDIVAYLPPSANTQHLLEKTQAGGLSTNFKFEVPDFKVRATSPPSVTTRSGVSVCACLCVYV